MAQAITVTKRPQKYDTSKARAYQTYYFTYKDPVIEAVRLMIVKSHLTWRQISQKANISLATLYNWFNGETRRPQFATIMAVIYACGFSLADLNNYIKIQNTPRRAKFRVIK